MQKYNKAQAEGAAYKLRCTPFCYIFNSIKAKTSVINPDIPHKLQNIYASLMFTGVPIWMFCLLMKNRCRMLRPEI